MFIIKIKSMNAGWLTGFYPQSFGLFYFIAIMHKILMECIQICLYACES